MRVDTHKCVSCGACARACKMDVDITKTPNHAECIRCGMCMKAVSYTHLCGYTVVPKDLERDGMNINKLWLRRQTTKFNGVPYVVQRAAAAVFTESGMAEIQQNLDYYRKNAKVIADALDAVSYTHLCPCNGASPC